MKNSPKSAKALSNKVKRINAGETVLVSENELARLKRFYGTDFIVQGASNGFLVSK